MHNRLRQAITAPIIIVVLALVAALIFTFASSATAAPKLSNSELVGLVAEYHVEANQLVDMRIKGVAEQLNQLKKKPSLRAGIQAKFQVPLNLEEQCLSDDKEQTELNYSSTCLYFELKLLRDDFLSKLPKAELNYDQLGLNSTELQSQAGLESEIRKKQSDLSLDLIDATLTAYNQIVTAAILHTENESTLAEIETLQDHLYDLDLITQNLPNRFHNVTTNQCR